MGRLRRDIDESRLDVDVDDVGYDCPLEWSEVPGGSEQGQLCSTLMISISALLNVRGDGYHLRKESIPTGNVIRVPSVQTD